MFGLSLLFLVFIAALVVVWIDIPRVDLTGSLTGRRGSESLPWELAGIRLGSYIAMGLFILWPLFIAEFLFNFLRKANRGKTFWQRNRSGLLVCFLPPLRLAAPCHAMNGRIWLPGLGWRMPGKRLSKTLESKFSKPMLFIAMLILPVLIVEFGLQDYVEQDFSARLALHLCTGFIWTAFSFEFIIRVSATHRKLGYLKRNWIDLAIILLPLISFLRSLRVIRAAKLAKFAQAQQLARIGRIYRLRSLAVKALRALILFEFFNRFLRITPEKKLAALRAEYRDRKEDLDDLKVRIDQLWGELQEKKTREATVLKESQEEGGTVSDPDCKIS